MHPALRALRYRSFRVFFVGQGVSIFGTWMQTLATSWLIYRLTGSAFMLGLSTAALQLPMLVLSPIAGVLADRLDRRRLLIVVQLLAGAQALVLAALTYAGVVQVWHVIALSLFLGAMNAIETPTRQALCFLLNGISYLGVVIAYLAIRVPARALRNTPAPLWRELSSGFRYALGSLATRRLIVLLAALSLFSAPWMTLMPLFAGETFAGDSTTLGLLIGAVGVGALGATGLLALRQSVRGLGRVIAAASITAALALTAFALSRWLWLSLVLLAIFGFGLIASVASTNTILQTIADEDKRGRIISMYVMTFLGLAPISNFIAGTIAQAVGAPWTIFGCGLCLTAATVWFAWNLPSWRAAVRPIYREQGIIPPPQEH